MKAWTLITAGLYLVTWAGHNFGGWPQTVVIGPLFLIFVLAGIHGVLWWRRLRALQSVLGFAWMLTAVTSIGVFAVLRIYGLISISTVDRWFFPGFVAWLVSLVGTTILFTLDRIDHPRRWNLVKEHVKRCSFVDSLLFRDIPDLTDHEDLYF